MGCYPPLAKFVSKVLRKCKGRERWRERRLDMDYAMAYPPGPPLQTHYMQPVARTVTFASNNNVYVIPPQQKTPPPSPPPPQQEQEQKQSTPEPPQQQQQQETPPQQAEPDHDQHDAPPQPQPDQPEQPPKPEQEEEKAPDAAPPAESKPKPPKGPKRGKNKKSGGRVRFGPEPPPPQEQEQEQHDAPDPGNGPGQGQHGHGPKGPGPAHQVPPYLLRYTPSPLPRWEATPRRHEYFSGEYRSYYPTPVREGIYRIATDANRLTTIFSEENPNACVIV